MRDRVTVIVMRRVTITGVCIAMWACAEDPDNLGPGTRDASDRQGIQLLRLSGEPASGALVYELTGDIGTLRDRADTDGFFSIAPDTPFLARSAFDEVVLGRSADPVRSFRLRATDDQNETLALRGVGMQMQIPELIAGAWPQKRGGFVFTTLDERGLQIWQWTEALGSRRVAAYPEYRGAVLNARQLTDALWLLVEGTDAASAAPGVTLVDTERGAAHRIDELPISVRTAGVLATAWNNTVFFFEPGSRFRVHRYDRSGERMGVDELPGSFDADRVVAALDALVWLSDPSSRWFFYVNLETLDAGEVAVPSPGFRVRPRGSAGGAGFSAATLDSPRIHWWNTARESYVSFDVGRFDHAELIQSDDPAGLFAALTRTDGGVNHLWLDADAAQVTAIDQLDELLPTADSVRWGEIDVRGDQVELVRVREGGVAAVVQLGPDKRLRVDERVWGQPSGCNRDVTGPRPRAIECSNDDERWMISEHDDQWLRRTFFRTVRGPVVESGRHVLVASFRDGFQTVFDTEAPP